MRAVASVPRRRASSGHNLGPARKQSRANDPLNSVLASDPEEDDHVEGRAEGADASWRDAQGRSHTQPTTISEGSGRCRSCPFWQCSPYLRAAVGFALVPCINVPPVHVMCCLLQLAHLLGGWLVITISQAAVAPERKT
jgi:hypothetical protein